MYLSTEQKSLFPQSDSTVRCSPKVTTLLEKGSGEMCEDAVLMAKNTYGVFDGATSLVPYRYAGRWTGGRMASSICKEAFSSDSGELSEMAETANRALAARAVAAGIDYNRKEELWSCSAAVVRLENDRLQWCRIGDCQIILLYSDGSQKSVGITVDHDAATLLSWQQSAHRREGSIMEAMAEEIADVRRRMNTDYGVLNGEPQALEFLQAGTVPLEGVEHVLLFTDGLVVPRRNPSAPLDLVFLDKIYRENGLHGVRNLVRKIQLTDPSCTTYPRFKIHDDIGAVALSFTD